MNFWILTFLNENGEKVVKKLAADSAYEKKKIKDDIRSIYPGIKGLTLKRGKKPPGWVLFEKNSNQ